MCHQINKWLIEPQLSWKPKARAHWQRIDATTFPINLSLKQYSSMCAKKTSKQELKLSDWNVEHQHWFLLDFFCIRHAFLLHFFNTNVWFHKFAWINHVYYILKINDLRKKSIKKQLFLNLNRGILFRDKYTHYSWICVQSRKRRTNLTFDMPAKI